MKSFFVETKSIWGLGIFVTSIGLFRILPDYWHLLLLFPIIIGSKWMWEK